jgi:hypothetical protein
MAERLDLTKTFATEGNLEGVMLEARFAGGIAASGQRAGFGGNLFTRDACRMMRDTMDHNPSMTRELLGMLPQMQGIEENSLTNESPDAMPHQTFRQIVGGRRLPDEQVANTEYWVNKWGVELKDSPAEGKNFTIYNSSDAPLLYLITLAEFQRLPEGKDIMKDQFIHRPTGKIRNVGEAGRRCVNAIMQSINWSEENGSGLYVVPNTNPKQTSPSGVMRDGFDSYYYPEGEQGKPVDFGFLAYIDNQALAYEALVLAAKELFPDDKNATEWLKKAEELRQRTIEAFWMEDSQFFAAAVDQNGKQVALESNAAAEILNGPFLKTKEGPEFVEAIVKWLYSEQVMTPIGPRMISQKFNRFEGDYYAYQGTGAVWPHANGIIAKGLRNAWGLYTPSHDIGINRTLGSFARSNQAYEVMFVERERNEPVYSPEADKVREAAGALAIAAAEIGQKEQGWAASAGLRELWDWKDGVPDEQTGTWQHKIAKLVMEMAGAIPSAIERPPTVDIFVDLKKGKVLKKQRAEMMGFAA